MLNSNKNLTDGGLITKNAILNIISQIAPILIGLVTIPMLIKHLGTEEYGVLTTAWMVIGFFSIFDLGIGRAITVFCADKLESNKTEDVPELIWTALFILAGLGLLATLIISLTANEIVENFLNVPILLRRETVNVVILLAVAISPIICTGCLLSFLVSNQKFNLISIVRPIMGSITYLGPLTVLAYSNSLTIICLSLVISKVLEFSAYAYLSIRINPNIWKKRKVNRLHIKPLLAYGGWMTVSNVVCSLMNYADRFFVAALLTTTAVAYYSTPSDLIIRFMIVPGAIVGVLFPAFCATYNNDKEKIRYLFKRGVVFTLIFVFPVILTAITLAKEILWLWLGDDFSNNSTSALQYLAIGGLANSISYIPFAIIQAGGKPDLTGKLHLIELPIFIIVFMLLIKNYGIEGAAIGCMLRSLFDTLILMKLASKLIKNDIFNRRLEALFSILLFISCLPLLLNLNIIAKIVFLLTTFTILGLMTYIYILEDDDKKIIKQIKILSVNKKKIK